MQRAETALLALGRALRRLHFSFTAVTPETHRRVVARCGPAGGRTLRDIFGWSLPFETAALPRALFTLLEESGALRRIGDKWRSEVRFATLGDDLFVHSAYPTTGADCVFFGPDTYRFARLLRAQAPKAKRCVDIGCGTGAGAMVLRDRVQRLVLADINAGALRLASVNAALAECSDRIELAESDVLRSVSGPVDLIIANPPYIVDATTRLYRHGGGPRGIDLAVRIVHEGSERLTCGGQLILYTGTPVVGGLDCLQEALRPLLASLRGQHTYDELDPDVFGEELEGTAYKDVERIAAVGLHLWL